MTKHDRSKLVSAGFSILRIHEQPDFKITVMTDSHSWSTYKKFDSKASLYREVTRINNDEQKIIFD